jgi:predicted adenine nucleotide alpha hydrolase (AANH) superfamily ATPase
MKEKFLLHTCCAPCSAYVIEELKDKYDLTLFFYNPNIHPNREYLKRKEELVRYCKKMDIKYIEGKYDIMEWFEITKEYKDEPEKGERCGFCFRMRLNETAEYAKNNNFDIWGTTLSISPHKDADLINNIGLELAGKYEVNYLEANWKKKGGFQKSCEISKEEDFYRQDYCGCTYSMRRLINKDKNKDGN